MYPNCDYDYGPSVEGQLKRFRILLVRMLEVSGQRGHEIFNPLVDMSVSRLKYIKKGCNPDGPRNSLDEIFVSLSIRQEVFHE